MRDGTMRVAELPAVGAPLRIASRPVPASGSPWLARAIRW